MPSKLSVTSTSRRCGSIWRRLRTSRGELVDDSAFGGRSFASMIRWIRRESGLISLRLDPRRRLAGDAAGADVPTPGRWRRRRRARRSSPRAPRPRRRPRALPGWMSSIEPAVDRARLAQVGADEPAGWRVRYLRSGPGVELATTPIRSKPGITGRSPIRSYGRACLTALRAAAAGRACRGSSRPAAGRRRGSGGACAGNSVAGAGEAVMPPERPADQPSGGRAGPSSSDRVARAKAAADGGPRSGRRRPADAGTSASTSGAARSSSGRCGSVIGSRFARQVGIPAAAPGRQPRASVRADAHRDRRLLVQPRTGRRRPADPLRARRARARDVRARAADPEDEHQTRLDRHRGRLGAGGGDRRERLPDPVPPSTWPGPRRSTPTSSSSTRTTSSTRSHGCADRASGRSGASSGSTSRAEHVEPAAPRLRPASTR